MAYSLIRTEDFNTYNLYQFVCDSDTDLDTIKTDYSTELTTGSFAYVKEDNVFVKYLVDTQREFVKVSND